MQVRLPSVGHEDCVLMAIRRSKSMVQVGDKLQPNRRDVGGVRGRDPAKDNSGTADRRISSEDSRDSCYQLEWNFALIGGTADELSGLLEMEADAGLEHGETV